MINTQQKDFCLNKNIDFEYTNPYQIAGIADNVQQGLLPINGLRHPQKGDTCGWYIWAGEELCTNSDFFKPKHVMHLLDSHPEIEKFLGLPPGWRFIYAPDFEDVWFDETLLDV